MSYWRSLAVLLCTAMMLPPLGAAPTATMIPYTKPGGRVDVAGGRRIDLRCDGHSRGEATVILMAGLTSFSLAWFKVQPAIALRTRVCAFDTAGYGFSDAPPKPQNISEVVDDLHTALTAAGIKPPYLLAAHSIAGVEARVFVQRWPGTVAAMVLVDSSFAGQGLVLPALPGFDAAGAEADLAKRLSCVELLARQTSSADGSRHSKCIGNVPAAAPEALKAMWPRFFTAAGAANTLSLGQSLAVSSYDTADRLHLGNMPIVVLTAGRSNNALLRRDYLDAFRKIWLDHHLAFARFSTRGIQRTVEDATHDIQRDRPDTVIDAINRDLDLLAQDKRDLSMPTR